LKNLNSLSRKLKELNQLENINSGGCAIVAYALSKYLINTETEIIYLLTKEDLDNDLISKIKEGKTSNCHHSVLKIEDRYIDTEGITSKYKIFNRNSCFPDEIVASISVPLDLVLKSINEEYWSNEFSRKDNLLKIDNILNLNGLLIRNIEV